MVCEDDVRNAITAHLSDAQVNVTDISNGYVCAAACRGVSSPAGSANPLALAFPNSSTPSCITAVALASRFK